MPLVLAFEASPATALFGARFVLNGSQSKCLALERTEWEQADTDDVSPAIPKGQKVIALKGQRDAQRLNGERGIGLVNASVTWLTQKRLFSARPPDALA